MPGSPATLHLTVTGAKGRPLAFRAEVFRGSERVAAIWNDTGSQQFAVTPDADALIVRHGFDYDAVELRLGLSPGETRERKVSLRRRFDAKALGWYCGESHMHGMHSKSDTPASFADGARLAAADGLDYLQIGFAWEPSFSWPTGEHLNAWAAEASTSEVTILWNCETPKGYMGDDDGGEKGNLHCYGHGLSYGLKDISKGQEFFFTGPNFKVMQEIRRQGGVTVCAHPLRFWFNKGNFVSNWASELPFDFVAGVPYAGVDIFNDSPLLFFQSEHLWWNLLNLGYRVSGTANSDGNLNGWQGVGRFRTYTKIHGPFSIEKVIEALENGACVASSGPFVLFEVDGRDPGAEFPADGKSHEATIRAWGGPLPGESLVSVQLVRNGEIVRAWDLHDQNERQWATSMTLSDREYAWYAVRVAARSKNRESVAHWGTNLYEVAVANPVYFLPAGFERPRGLWRHGEPPGARRSREGPRWHGHCCG